jgi:predicted DNA binding CopG/RHH family protein
MKVSSQKLKPLPALLTDDQAEAFVDTADLTEYDLSQFKPMRFELVPKTERVNMRLPKPLLDAVRASAEREGIPYQRYIRRALEMAVAEPLPKAGRRKRG